jgi:hypothetical protein
VELASATSPSSDWYYSGWQYRKAHDQYTAQPTVTNFYSLSSPWAVISGNPTQRHTFQPVHGSAIIEVNKPIDGNTWKYLAYDSEPEGSQIRLYYTNDTTGVWTPYSQNPILGPRANYYRWPSTTYVNGIFYMFIEDRTGGALERWSSTDGIHYTYVENVKTGGNEYKNPFIYYNSNNNRWYLYSHDASGITESLLVRSATTLDGLHTASDTTVLTRNLAFGSATVMYYGGYYWLLAEIFQNNVWKVVAYYSTSPQSGFVETSNSPILSADQACPMLFLTPAQTSALLFTTEDGSAWYQRAREVNLNSSIHGQPIELSNYQIKINVNYGSGASEGDTVYLSGRCQPSFGDVRFTWYNAAENTEVECPYWTEQVASGSNAVFWVKVPQIQSSNSTLYIYYGQSNAVSTSNGNQTFEFFDDFSGTLSKWTTVGGSWQIQSGELVGSTTTFGQRLRANNFVFTNNTVHVNVKWISGTYFEGGPFIRGESPNEQNYGYMTFLSTWAFDSRDRISLMSGGGETTLAAQGTTNPSKNVWYNFTFRAVENGLSSTIMPLYPTEIGAYDSTFSSGTLCLFAWSAASEVIHYDNVFVTKASSTEPTQGSWYSEETAPTAVTVEIDNSSVSDSRTDVGDSETVAFHAKWSNGTAITAGVLSINGTQLSINSTGWATLTASYPTVTAATWAVTTVNVSGVTVFAVTASTPSIIWDQIKLVDGAASPATLYVGENATVWLKAVYHYDNKPFNATVGSLWINGQPMEYSTTNSRWEAKIVADTPGALTLQASSVSDSQYGLTELNDVVDAITLSVFQQPFTTLSNSTVTNLAFNSTAGIICFTVSGPSGTTGFVNLTLAKSLVSNVSNLQIFIDDHQTSYSATETAFYWMLSFNYSHSMHNVLVLLDETPEGQTSALTELNPQSFGVVAPTNPPPTAESQVSFSVLQLAIVVIAAMIVCALVALSVRGLQKQPRSVRQ